VKFGPKSQLARLGTKAFGKVGLSMLALPASLTLVEDGAFAGSTNLLLIKFAAGSQLQAVTKGTFAGTVVEDLVLPAIQAIAEDAFDDLKSLAAIDFVAPAGLPQGAPLAFPAVVLNPPWQVTAGNQTYFRRPAT
jgi:hypothetical protein